MGLFGIFKKNKKERIEINDNIFGNLMLIDEGWVKAFEIKLFDNNYDIDLIVENDENGEKSISEKQKNMYMKFIEEQIRIKSEVERIITEKYNFIDKSELLNSRPLSIYFELSGNVKLTCSIGSEGDEIIEIELLPQVKFNKVL